MKKNKCTSCLWNSKASENKIVCLFPKCIYSSRKWKERDKNGNTGNLVGGHQRFKILLDKGIDEVSVSVVNLDETKEKLLNLALNKIAGEWDEDKLESLLTEIKDCADIVLSDFDEREIDNIIRVCSQESDNFINELINDDFVSINSEKEYFQVSFSFENKYKNVVENFIKETGKPYIVKKILQWIQGEDECLIAEVK